MPAVKDASRRRRADLPDRRDDHHRTDRAQGPAADGHRSCSATSCTKAARVARLTKASENEIANIATLFLGVAIGATMQAEAFLKPTTLAIFALGFVAICLDTVVGVLFGKVWYCLSGGKMNPLIGAAGISAYPMAARVVQARRPALRQAELPADARHGRQYRRPDRLGRRRRRDALRAQGHGPDLTKAERLDAPLL